jgi:ATP-binding cassette, subfamily B, multidrug efflux pump
MSGGEERELETRGIDLGLLGRLLAYLRPYAGWVALTFGLICAAALANQAGPLLTQIAVDGYIETGDAAGLGDIALLYAALLVLQFGLGYAQTWSTSMVGQWAMRDVRQHLFSHLQRLPLRFFDRTPIGRLMARNTSDIDALNELFTDGIVSMLSDVLTISAILGYIFYMDAELGWVTAAVLPFAFMATLWLQRRTFSAFREARTRFARFTSHLQETLSGMEVVQLFGFETTAAKRLGQANDGYLDALLRRTFYHSIYFPFMELCGSLLLALVLWYAGGQALRGELEWGVLLAMFQYVLRFFMPMRDIAERYAVLQVAMASSERIFELLDEEPEEKGGDHVPDQVEGAVEFRDVHFAYTGEDWVLRGVSFKAEPGQSLAIVGATGAGKSTIINLVCRFYEIQRGQILVDGVDVRQWDLAALRGRIGLVQQDVFLFAGDIGSNIRLGDPSIEAAEVEAAATSANADRFITKLPQGYQQPVNERGVSLSAGQRQLLAFARALVRRPDILVLDEATANVDTETEVWIQEAVEKLMHQRTTIAIAHRLSTIRNADRILVLHRGLVREQGSHDELMQLEGIYHRLHQLQFEEQDLND